MKLRTVKAPRPGDWAYHKGGLDPRQVTEVKGSDIWLFILTGTHGPFPKKNYVFKREVKES